MSIERFEDASFSEWRRDLLRQKGGGLQQDFLYTLQDSERFCRHLEKTIRKEPGTSLPVLDRKLTEANYAEPPEDIEKWVFEQWKGITPAEACDSSVWGWLSFRHIQERIIESHFLAANGRSNPGGKERIARALKEGDAKKIDNIVRISLRRLCGLREARGNRSVYSDCVFARAWWRNYLCREVCKEPKADPNAVLGLFRQSKGYWEKLITFVVSRNSVLGDMKVRDALVLTLSKQAGKDNSESSDILSNKALDKIVRRIGACSAWRELGIFSMDELKEMMEKEFIGAAV